MKGEKTLTKIMCMIQWVQPSWSLNTNSVSVIFCSDEHYTTTVLARYTLSESLDVIAGKQNNTSDS